MVLLLRILFAVVANGVALLLAAAILDDFEVEAGSFAVAVIVFSVASLVLRPIVIMLVGRYARPMLGVVALVSTYVVLLVTICLRRPSDRGRDDVDPRHAHRLAGDDALRPLLAAARAAGRAPPLNRSGLPVRSAEWPTCTPGTPSL